MGYYIINKKKIIPEKNYLLTETNVHNILLVEKSESTIMQRV